ncbi:MAG: hypothetical protein ACOCTO_03570 [Marinilabiliaceae bacterium]
MLVVVGTILASYSEDDNNNNGELQESHTIVDVASTDLTNGTL